MATKTQERQALLTQAETAALLGISKHSMKRLLATGKLEVVRLPGLGWPRFRRTDVERLIAGEVDP
jgi:excisionase family DNA binding protein